MTRPDTSHFVQLHAELVLEVVDAERLRDAARGRVEGDAFMPAEEREHARILVEDDVAEALAYLVDPLDLARGIPGVELGQASWTSEQIDYDPQAPEWNLGADLDIEPGEG